MQMSLIEFEQLLEKEGFEMTEDNTDALNYGSRVFKRSSPIEKEEEIITINYIRKE